MPAVPVHETPRHMNRLTQEFEANMGNIRPYLLKNKELIFKNISYIFELKVWGPGTSAAFYAQVLGVMGLERVEGRREKESETIQVHLIELNSSFTLLSHFL